ncbi:MAG: methyl-accepting chemotaxis protein [Candidatus Omnitrophota bacterium]|jgi:methyl-accepting chemotaxis protein
MAKSKYQRSQYIVDKRIQYRFAGFVMLFATGAAVLVGSVIFFTTLFFLGDKLAAVYPAGRLQPIVRSAYSAFFVNIIIAMPIIFFVSIRFSHKIVGPLPKIYRYLKSIGSGTYPGRLTLRTGDELTDLAEAVNAMAEDLKARGSIDDISK